MPRPILVCGLPHISAKIARHYQMLSQMAEAKVVIYSRDVSGNSDIIAQRFKTNWRKVPQRKLSDWTCLIALSRLLQPAHIELYHDSQSDLVHLGYLAAALSHRIPIVAFCRGGELLYWGQHSLRRKSIIRFGLQAAQLILYKELYMPARLQQLGIPKTKRYFLFNRVPVTDREPLPASRRLGVLYLNSWKSFRRPDIALEVGLRLAKQFPQVQFTVGGERYWTTERFSGADFEQRISAAGVGDHVRVLPWTENPHELFAQYSIFLLPAREVFLNYTLLEAMERGLAPVIAKVEGAERIVSHGQDGLIVDLNADAFTEAVEYLLSHPSDLKRMAGAARRKVRECFDLQPGLEQLIEVYRDKVW